MRKTRRVGLGLIFMVLLLLLSTATAIADDSGDLEAKLRGKYEAPGPGDPDGRGEAEVEIKHDYKTLCYELKVSRIAPATAAHIHVGAKGVAGPVVVGLTAPTSGKSKGCLTVDPALGRAIAEHPENYYVNVHNSEYPAGALRGQLEED